jgi:predicted ArsR family transcriptional regulator
MISALKFIVDGTAEVMMQPARFKILQHLRQAREPQFVDQIAKSVGVHPRMVSHHLDVLEEQELVRSAYELVPARGSRRRVAVRMCQATAKAEKVVRDIQESVL